MKHNQSSKRIRRYRECRSLEARISRGGARVQSLMSELGRTGEPTAALDQGLKLSLVDRLLRSVGTRDPQLIESMITKWEMEARPERLEAGRNRRKVVVA